MENLKNLSGKQLAKLLNKFDLEEKEDESILVELEMDFRYFEDYKNELIENN